MNFTFVKFCNKGAYLLAFVVVAILLLPHGHSDAQTYSPSKLIESPHSSSLTSATITKSNNVSPQRIVSINICTDALLADLVDLDRVAAISVLGADERYSPRARQLQSIAVTNGNADSILSFKPDMVIAGKYAKIHAVSLLRRVGVNVVSIDLARSIDEAYEQILLLGEKLGVDQVAHDIVASMKTEFQRMMITDTYAPIDTLLLRPNGFTSGRNTLVGDLIAILGFNNIAGSLGITTWGFIDMESLILSEPKLLILDDSEIRSPSLASAFLSHAALMDLRSKRMLLNSRSTGCAGPWLVDAARELVLVRSQFN